MFPNTRPCKFHIALMKFKFPNRGFTICTILRDQGMQALWVLHSWNKYYTVSRGCIINTAQRSRSDRPHYFVLEFSRTTAAIVVEN